MPSSGPAESIALGDLVVERREGAAITRRILDGASLAVAPGEIVAVTGPSGSGKTTLLHVAAGLLRPASGRVTWGELDLATASEARRDRWRRASLGLIFQDFQLIAELSVMENILLPTRFDHWRAPPAIVERARMLADRVGLAGRTSRAASLSRGEQQRLAIARALVRWPRLIVADEPTASLDADNSARVADLLIECAREAEAAILLAAHDPRLLDRATHVHRLVAGRLVAGRERAS